MLRPALGHLLPKEHHKWIDFIVGMVCKVRSRASACDWSCLYFIYHLSPHRSVFSSTVLAVQSTRTECFDALISRLQSPWRLQGLPLCSLPLQLSIPLRGGLVGFYRLCALLVQSVAVSVASFLIAVISSVQCALRGGLLCSRALMRCVYASPLASAPVVSCARVSALGASVSFAHGAQPAPFALL